MGNRYQNAGRGAKSPRLIVRLSDAENALLRELAARERLSVAEYVRRRLFGKEGQKR